MSDFVEERAAVVEAARSIFNRMLTHGSTGNISVRAGTNILVTPTESSMGTVVADELSLIDSGGRHVSGPRPSKEAFLHAAMLRARPGDRAVVHTHSTHAVAVSCLADIDADNALPPLTAYFAMRIGRLPLLPYFAPGDRRLEHAASKAAVAHRALLLRNHGPIVAGVTVGAALDSIEELEETAKIFLILKSMTTRPLTPGEYGEVARSGGGS